MADNSYLLFNGKSMRNAIIQKLVEDHNLTSAAFSNSNITILIDIISYMYQSMMNNLRFAASESMFTDTMLFENATRLAKLIGYYAKGMYPYSLIAKIQTETATQPVDNNILSEMFLSTTLSYGPYSFDFALVDDMQDVNADDTKYVKLVLGDWDVTSFKSTGSKFEEFEIPSPSNADTASNKFISQQHVKVFVNGEQWYYSDTPVFAMLNDAKTKIDNQHRLVSNDNVDNIEAWRRFNFYIDENNNYILKFGDGLGSAIPQPNSDIVVVYVTSNETSKTISQEHINAIASANPGQLKLCGKWSAITEKLPHLTIDDISGSEIDLYAVPITKLGGFKTTDSVDSIKTNAMQSFNRQQRVVTKSDYKSYLMQNDSTVVDCLVQNNWDLIATYYGYIYNLAKQTVLDRKEITFDILTSVEDDAATPMKFLHAAARKAFGATIDAADANNVYLWILRDHLLGLNDGWTQSVAAQQQFGLGNNTIVNKQTIFENVKNVTEHIVELQPIWRTYCPFVSDAVKSKFNYVNILSSMQNIADITNWTELLNATKSTINIYADLRYINNIARIKSAVNVLFKKYLYDDIKLGVAPNISQLLKDLLSIIGVNAVTTVYTDVDNKQTKEVQGLQFLSWTAVEIVDQPICFDTMLTYGLPQINQFEYLKCAIGYSDFIANFIKILPDYNRSR